LIAPEKNTSKSLSAPDVCSPLNNLLPSTKETPDLHRLAVATTVPPKHKRNREHGTRRERGGRFSARNSKTEWHIHKARRIMP
jgi:hypothetical protein